MFTIKIDGHVTDDGQLKFDLPADLPPGDVKITIEAVAPEVDPSEQFTDKEIAELSAIQPGTMGDIINDGLLGIWADKGINDSVEFVDDLRRQILEHRKW
jgi:hypothetical protein